MPFPRENPTAKHDLFLDSNRSFPISREELMMPSLEPRKETTESNHTQESSRRHLVVYTYQNPCPFRRSMAVVGSLCVFDHHLQEQLREKRGKRLSCCIVSVKRYNAALTDKDRCNSKKFAGFLQGLRRDKAVALLSQDKHGRMGFLMPLSTGSVGKYTATCCIGEAAAVVELLMAAAGEQKSSACQQPRINHKPGKTHEMKLAGKPFHKDPAAAAADSWYTELPRNLDTRGDSKLYHMRSFHGWVKAMQIQELNPKTQQQSKNAVGGRKLRVLDLACGKGGDLRKWVYHPRGVERYVGIDVARGSLCEAAIRAQQLPRRKMPHCQFVCADLGSDVPGRPSQNLLAWSLPQEADSSDHTQPEFAFYPGGSILPSEKFDVVSIQFAIHYMMSTRERARRFFRTVSGLLEEGGELIATTVDARVVIEHLLDLGQDLHCDDETQEKGSYTISVGEGACHLRFQRDIIKRIFPSTTTTSEPKCDVDDLFGLKYTFTLNEGSNHAAGVGKAVDLPEWLTPLPLLVSLAEEVGLQLVCEQNFHEFFTARKDPKASPWAHHALQAMRVLNSKGTVSTAEWEISRLYCALKFKKVGGV